MGVDSGETTLPALEDELSTGKYQAVFHNGDLGYDLNSDGGAVSIFVNNLAQMVVYLRNHIS